MQSSAPKEGYAPPPRSFESEAEDARDRRPPREFTPAEPLPEVPEGGYAFEDDGQQTVWRLAVGRRHGAQPGHIVGAIANEAKLQGPQINGVDVRADYSLVRLPAALPEAVIARLSKVRIRGQELALSPSNLPPRPAKKATHRKGPGKPRY